MDRAKWRHAAAGALLAAGPLLQAATDATAATCSARSTERKVALLELYTSEGCSSCPPADRWVSGLPARGLTAERVVVLGYHVDYWDYIGWPDPYAKPRYSERQRHANARNGARFVYTPQLMLNGKDYRRGFWRDDFGATVDTINREKPGAELTLELAHRTDAIEAGARVAVNDALALDATDVFLILLENRLGNQVTAGENRGRELAHDFVVREIAGPFAARHTPSPQHRFVLGNDWKAQDLSVAVFAQRRDTGAVLQALALAACGTKTKK